MSVDCQYDHARKVITKINDLRATIEMLGDFWPSKSDSDNDSAFEQVEKYLQRKIEILQTIGED